MFELKIVENVTSTFRRSGYCSSNLASEIETKP
jgi:hypothetical protein